MACHCCRHEYQPDSFDMMLAICNISTCSKPPFVQLQTITSQSIVGESGLCKVPTGCSQAPHLRPSQHF